MKIDLVMWTLNSENTLDYALRSIKKAIPENKINKKIMVDGGSIDNTTQIAENYDWHIYYTQKGIGRQANYALSLVQTDYFASFEHDIILSSNWFERILPTIYEKKDVAVTQGVRIALNPILKSIETYGIMKKFPYSSIDNNIYNTQIIRKIGGFSEKHPYSSDRELQDRVRLNGYKWVVNRNIISKHLVLDFFNRSKHVYEAARLNDYPKHNKKTQQMKSLLFSPIRGLQIVRATNYPLAFFAYPYWRAYRLLSALKTT